MFLLLNYNYRVETNSKAYKYQKIGVQEVKMSKLSNYLSGIALCISLGVAAYIYYQPRPTAPVKQSPGPITIINSSTDKYLFPLQKKLEGLEAAVTELARITSERDSVQAVLDSLVSTGKQSDYKEAVRLGEEWCRESQRRLRVKVDAFSKLIGKQ